MPGGVVVQDVLQTLPSLVFNMLADTLPSIKLDSTPWNKYFRSTLDF